MTAPALSRPSVGTTRLRDGTTAITVSAGPHRVIVRHAHVDALLDDIDDVLDQMGDQ